ncbi:MAG: hypothetical protein E7379_01155 [Clostridiales bacterium]|nr:hypothetical protein [Clostridiales bacterium]
MERLNSLISKNIISLQEGKLCGYVLDLVFDENLKRFEGCVVCDDENENTFFLRRQDMVSVGDDCIVVEGEDKLEFEISSSSGNPIGKNVYDDQGWCLGKVVDVCVSGKYVKKIVTNKCEIPQSLIYKSGVDFIIFGIHKKSKDRNKKLIFKNQEKLSNFKEKLPKSEIKTAISLINNKTGNENQIRLFANPNILLGRTITSDLFGMNNELIAKKDEIINKNTIKNAKNHNKLNILSYFSK